MLTNPRSDRVKAVRALSRRSVRSRTGQFRAEGPQAVREAVRFVPEHVRDLYVTAEGADRHTDVIAAAHDAKLWVHEVTPEVLTAMCDAEHPQGLMAVCRWARLSLDDALGALPHDALVCVLAHVRDPGNAGTVIRGADAAGADRGRGEARDLRVVRLEHRDRGRVQRLDDEHPMYHHGRRRY